MINILLLILAVSTATPTFSSFSFIPEIFWGNAQPKTGVSTSSIHDYPNSFDEINAMLQKQGDTLHPQVINKVITALNCANEHNVQHNNILTVIDYSLPSSEKRLWVFDLKQKKMLFHTYVSHGIRSGTLFSNYFSNVNNSKASSIGVYKTDKAYYGREGLSLRLSGLERTFNDNASMRSVVMHGGWYVQEPFIKKYGRAGRSWGCPAIPLSLYQPIINAIKDNSLFVVYYPSDDWFVKSRFLNCGINFPTQKLNNLITEAKPLEDKQVARDNVLFVATNKFSKVAVDAPIVTMAADKYERIYHNKPPLERMLRRQINNSEYIALSNTEFNQLVTHGRENLNNIDFVIAVLKMSHGYYETEMKIVNLGKIKDVRFNGDSAKNIVQAKNYTVYFDSKPFINLKSSNRFIRWLGL